MSKRIIAGLLLAATLSPAFALPHVLEAPASSDDRVHRSALGLCVLACLALGSRARLPRRRALASSLHQPYTLRYSSQYDNQPQLRQHGE